MPDGLSNPAAGRALGSAAFASLVCSEFTNPVSREELSRPPGEADGCGGMRKALKAEGFFVVRWLISMCVDLCAAADDSLVSDSSALLLLLLPWRAWGAAGSWQPSPPCEGFCFNPAGEGVGLMLGPNQPLHLLGVLIPTIQHPFPAPCPVPGQPVPSAGTTSPFPRSLGTWRWAGLGGDGQ